MESKNSWRGWRLVVGMERSSRICESDVRSPSKGAGQVLIILMPMTSSRPPYHFNLPRSMSWVR